MQISDDVFITVARDLFLAALARSEKRTVPPKLNIVLKDHAEAFAEFTSLLAGRLKGEKES